jgi:hypothetical protein
MNKYKVYALIEKNTNDIRYIGITIRSLNERFRKHICDKQKTHKTNWIKKVGHENIYIKLIDDTITSIEDLKNKEIFYIDKYKKDGYKLTNTTNGGDGWNGSKFSEDHKKKISLNHIDVSGNKNPMFGKSHTLETINKISETKKSKAIKLSKESIENLSNKNKGELNKNSKLTKEDVTLIRKYYDIGYKKSDLSKMFGVNQPAIYKIIKRLTWKHI